MSWDHVETRLTAALTYWLGTACLGKYVRLATEPDTRGLFRLRPRTART